MHFNYTVQSDAFSEEVHHFLAEHLSYDCNPGGSAYAYMEQPPDHCFTARGRTGELVGVACFDNFPLQADFEAQLVKYLAVHRSYRKRGIAKALIYNILSNNVIHYLVVYPEPCNTSGIGFYKKIGFEEMQYDPDDTALCLMLFRSDVFPSV